MHTWFFALTSIFLASVGQLLLKYGLNSARTDGLSSLSYLKVVAVNPCVVGGLLSYGLSVILWLLALRQTQLSLLYPLVSLSYVLVAAGSALILGETLPPVRVVGIAVIIAGVLLVVRS